MRDSRPDIIGITEVNPKNSAHPPSVSEYNLSEVGNYNMFHTNIGNSAKRGIVLYINSELDANEVKLTTNFEENVFVSVKLNIHDELLIGVVYRSESGSALNNDSLNSIITEASKSGYKKILIMGDFNYPNIDWGSWSARGETEYKFLDKKEEI